MDLRLQPFQTLWYLHIQPPGFDALRALLVHTIGKRCPYEALVVRVDTGLRALWAIVFGATMTLIFFWASALFASLRAGLITAALWMLNPAAWLYATLLDSTTLGACGLLWCLYEIWAQRPQRTALAVLALFLIRSHFQWPFAALVALSLYVRGVRGRRLAAYILIVACGMAPLYIKQRLVFGLPVTSSFFGDSACKSLGLFGPAASSAPAITVPGASTARVLTRWHKPDGSRNYNHIGWLSETQARARDYRQALHAFTWTQLIDAYWLNARIFLEPTSRFARSPINERLPWRGLYDFLFAGAPLLILCALGAALWMWRVAWPVRLARIALALPILYVAMVSIAFERKEGMRYRHFVEPAVYVWLASSAGLCLKQIRNPRAAVAESRQAAPKAI
jgi:hypothetical protein